MSAVGAASRAMAPFECRVDGARVVVDATPMMLFADVLELCARRAGGEIVISKRDGGTDDDDRATHDALVNGRLATRETVESPLRFLNLGRGGKVELVRRERDGRAREDGDARTRTRAPATGTGTGTRATTTTTTTTTDGGRENESETIVSLSSLDREYRVIRRSTEIEEGPALPREEPPDEFFELTTTDAMGLVKKCAREPILMTRKMREAAARERVRPTRAVIRFTAPPPSDLVVEASFGAEERVRDLYGFAEACARSRDEAASIELFVTPPKRVLRRNDETTLLDAGFAPAARVRVGVKSAATSFACAEAAESIFRDDLIALAAERKPTVRVIEKRAAESVAEPPSPADERTTEDKKKALLDKMKRGGKPSWLKR